MKLPLMSKTPLCYTLTTSLVTDSMTYLKFLEQLILATVFRGLETHKSVLLSCCPFWKQPRFTDQQLLEKGQRAKGTNSLASLSFLLNFYELSSDRCAAFLCTSSWRPSFSFPSVGFEGYSFTPGAWGPLTSMPGVVCFITDSSTQDFYVPKTLLMLMSRDFTVAISGSH